MEVRNKSVLADNPYPSRLNHKFHPSKEQTMDCSKNQWFDIRDNSKNNKSKKNK